MIEQKLKQLQTVSATDAVKNDDWEKIVQKDRTQPSFYWKEIGAIITVLAIAFALFYLNNSTEKQATDPFAEIKTIYFSNRDPKVEHYEPKSNFYPFVHKFEGEGLDAINEKLKASTWQPIDEGVLKGSYVTYKFVFADGTSKVVRDYIEDTSEYTEYLYEEKTGYAYILQTNSFQETIVADVMLLYSNVNDYKRMIVILFLLISISILSLTKNYYYKKETGIQKLPKKLVNKKQYVVQFLILFLLLATTIITQNVHYVWWIVGLVTNIWVLKLLDDQSEHYKWRMVDNFLRNILVLVLVLLTYFYYLF